MHGGGSTGAKTAEGRARIVAARTIHGGYGAEARGFQAHVSALIRRGRVMRAFAKADLPFTAMAPLIHQAQAMAPNPGSAASKGNTPYTQRKRQPRSAKGAAQTSETTDAMLALMTLDLTARQARVLAHLIRDAGRAAPALARRRQPSARTKTLRREQPMHPGNGADILGRSPTQGSMAAVRSGPTTTGGESGGTLTQPTFVLPGKCLAEATPSGNTPYNVKPNRATRRKIAAQARQANSRGGKR